ncbi:MAG: LruC domain-containing protein [bacterium]
MKTVRNFSGIIFLFLMIFFAGCKKDFDPQPSPGEVSKMTDITVPYGFNWKTTRTVTLNLSLDVPNSSSTYSRITVYDKEPFNGGNAIFSGSVAKSFPLVAKISIPTALTQLYFQLSPSSGYTQLVTVNVSDNIQYAFTEPGGGGLLKGTDVVEPDCNTGCDVTISGTHVTKLTINDGQTYCITTSYSGEIEVEEGTLKICGNYSGTGNNGKISVGKNGKTTVLIITSTAQADISTLELKFQATATVYSNATAVIGQASVNQDATFTNYGTTSINSNFTPDGLIQNFGDMTVNGQYNMNGNSASLINTGYLTINSHWNAINPVTNNGTIEVFGDMNCNNAEFLNTCALIVHGFFHLNNEEFTNETGYIKCYGETKIQGGQSFMKLRNQSMISTKDLTLNADITGEGIQNEIRVTNDIRFDGPNVITGPIETAQTTGVLQNGTLANFTNGATFVSFANITNTIPTSPCNPEGVNPPGPCPDTDGDGVTDCDDDYPDDPDRAFNNYTTGTAVYEDLWPSQGDYDMNDLVMYYKYNMVTNAQNKVVDVVSKFYVLAAGAGMRNGFGFQFDDVTPGQVASVTGYDLTQGYITLSANGTESNQAKAVVIVFDNHDNVINRADASTFFNTLPNHPEGTADTVTVTVHFTTPLSTTVVGTAPFNPFLIKNMDRAVEIHLPDYVPTSLASPSYFGMSDDNSNPATGRYYKTSGDLPWAINLPVVFDYPVEYADITQAYNHFAEWAQSGGTAFPNWYLNLPGYRNNSNIY